MLFDARTDISTSLINTDRFIMESIWVDLSSLIQEINQLLLT